MFGHSDSKKDNQQPINDVFTDEHQDNDIAFNPALPPEDNQPQPAAVIGGQQAPSISSAPAVASLDDEPLDETAVLQNTAPAVATAPLDEPVAVATDAVTDTSSTSVGTGGNDLLTIKQQALDQLSPLVNHLEQSPEEKFRTTMMMIQANDNQDLIKVAYDAAQAITDEKLRAKALLDIVNEINYFTHQKQHVA